MILDLTIIVSPPRMNVHIGDDIVLSLLHHHVFVHRYFYPRDKSQMLTNAFRIRLNEWFWIIVATAK